MTFESGTRLGPYDTLSRLGKGRTGEGYRARNTRSARTATVKALPPQPGTYVLVLRCRARRRILVGQLGTMELQPGFYAYVGSALGPGGLHARIARHLRRAKKLHWHVDYLRVHARVDQVWYCDDGFRREHQWAQALEATPGASVPLPGFGASDCGCRAHLFFFKRRPLRTSYERWLPGRMAQVWL